MSSSTGTSLQTRKASGENITTFTNIEKLMQTTNQNNPSSSEPPIIATAVTDPISVPISQQKRTNVSCLRCRKRHIKCIGSLDGTTTCEKCLKANAVCEYVEADKKVVVSVRYLQRLHEDVERLKKENTSLKANLKHGGKVKGNNTVTTSDDNEKSKSSDKDGDTVGSSSRSGTGNGLDGLLETTDVSSILSSTFSNNTASNNPNEMAKTATTAATATVTATESNDKTSTNSDQDEVIAPLIDQDRRLIYSRTGEKFYVGSSSMTLFGIQVQNMLRHQDQPPHSTQTTSTSTSDDNQNFTQTETILDREGNAYRIMLGRSKSSPGVSVNFELPSYSYAMLLVDTFIQYNDGCFYFFNEGVVKENLRRIYNGLDVGHSNSIIETIWFCKVLLIFAVGEMYLGTANNLNGTYSSTDSNSGTAPATASDQNSAKLPGSGFFHQASDIFTGLFSSGAIDNLAREGGVEVLLLYAFYLQVADCTVASYFYFGLALRTSLILGMHVDADKENLSRYELEHRRRLWWTVYMYERMLSSKAGLPLSLTDNSIATELPDDFDMRDPPQGCEHYIFPEAEYITNCVKITQINAKILSCLYQQKQDNNILPVLIELVGQLIEWKQQLPKFLKPDFSAKELQISRLVTNIMSEYWSAINLSVRPLLFHFAAKQLKTNKRDNKYIDLGQYSKPIIVLFNSSFQGSINLIRSLWSLMPDNMVALFGYMDREYLFTSAATLIIFNAAFGVHSQTWEHLDHALQIFTKMRNLGNHPANLRRVQLLKLMSSLDFNGLMEGLIRKHEDGVIIPVPNPALGEGEVPLEESSSSKLFQKRKTNNQVPLSTNLRYQQSSLNPKPIESSIRSKHKLQDPTASHQQHQQNVKRPKIVAQPPPPQVENSPLLQPQQQAYHHPNQHLHHGAASQFHQTHPAQFDPNSPGSSTYHQSPASQINRSGSTNSTSTSTSTSLDLTPDVLTSLLHDDFLSLENSSENELWKEISSEAVWLNSLAGDSLDFQGFMDMV